MGCFCLFCCLAVACSLSVLYPDRACLRTSCGLCGDEGFCFRACAAFFSHIPRRNAVFTSPVVSFLLLRAQIRAGSVALLYVSPERFNNERFVNTLKGVKVALFVVDEAHCISEVLL